MTNMKAQILQYVKDRDRSSFAEFHREITGFKGELEMRINGFENIVLWAQMSSDAIDALNDLLNEQSLFMVPTPALTYLLDGGSLTYPVAKSARNYKSPRWLPVLFTDQRPKVTEKRSK